MSVPVGVDEIAPVASNIIQLQPKTAENLKSFTRDQLQILRRQASKICGDLPTDPAQALIVLSYALAMELRIETLGPVDIAKILQTAHEHLTALLG